LIGIALAGCTGGQTANVPGQTSVNPVTQSANLQFAVGTANIQGTATGMNVIETNRQANGDSSVLVSTPFITGPFTLPPGVPVASAASDGTTATKGPSTAETAGTIPECANTPCIAGVPQAAAGVTKTQLPYVATFGQNGGAFGLGFEPANEGNNVTAVNYVPYGVPLYAPSIFIPWGGPPSYDPNGDGKGTRDGISGDYTKGVLGSELGLDIFQGVTPAVGTYSLQVEIPTYAGIEKIPTVTFPMTQAPALPTIAAPTLTVDASGNITATATLPASAPAFVGGYIEVVTSGTASCNAAGNLELYGKGVSGNTGAAPQPTVYYTQWFAGLTGTLSVTSKNAPGPAGSTFPAICSGDTATAYVIGFDYDHHAITYTGPAGGTFPAKPPFPTGSADVSISPAATFVAP
jgi:hypothetical protein